jgi:hypothetical protein
MGRWEERSDSLFLYSMGGEMALEEAPRGYSLSYRLRRKSGMRYHEYGNDFRKDGKGAVGFETLPYDNAFEFSEDAGDQPGRPSQIIPAKAGMTKKQNKNDIRRLRQAHT